jgi:hypothetical protein
MNKVFQEIHAIGTRAWVRFVQALNWIMVSVAGSLVVVNATYPGVIANAINKLPPALGVPLIVIFGVLVHYALRRAKVSPND